MCWLVQVGTVDGRGYDGQQEDTIYNVRGPWQTIQSQFFADSDWLETLTSCLDA